MGFVRTEKADLTNAAVMDGDDNRLKDSDKAFARQLWISGLSQPKCHMPVRRRYKPLYTGRGPARVINVRYSTGNGLVEEAQQLLGIVMVMKSHDQVSV